MRLFDKGWIKGRWIQGAILAIAIVTPVSPLPAHAQSDQQVRALVEALRLAAAQTGNLDDGLYSDWQIQAQNIPRWSASCTGRRLTPQQFEADSATARSILACVMRDVLQEEYRNSGSNEAIAVRRAAAWWMTGDPSRYNSGETAAYTQRVLGFYEQQAANPPDSSPGNPSPGNPSPGNLPTENNLTETRATPAQSTPYDRYMQAGYAAVQARNYESALLNFRRALDERPDDAYAQRAIENVERYQSGQTGGQ